MLMMYYMMPLIVIECTKLLDKNYDSKDPLTIAHSKVNKYLSMAINFSLKRGVAMC